MPSTRDIRRRITSVKKTAQITNAMSMVAQAKMARAQQAAIAGRPYAELMNRMLGEVVTHAGDFEHPLMEARGGERRAERRAVRFVRGRERGEVDDGQKRERVAG